MRIALNSHFKSDTYGPLFISAVLSLFWAIAMYVFIGYYFEDHTGLPLNIQSGYFTGGVPYDDFYVYCQTFVGVFYAFLHSLAPSFPWVSVIFYIALYCASVTFCTAVLHVLKKAFPSLSVRSMFFLGSVFFLLVLAENYIFFSGVRVSFLATACAFVGFTWLVRQYRFGLKLVFVYFLFFAVFLVGFLARYESGLGACLLIGIFSVLYGESFKRLLVIYLPAFLFAVFTLVYLHFKAYENEYLNAIEPDVYLLSDAKYNPDFYAGKTLVDSMRYQAVLKYMINDEGTITPALIKTMIKEKMLVETKQPSFITHSFGIAAEIILPALKQYIQLFLFNMLLLVVAVSVYRKGFGSVRFILAYLVYQVFFWVVIFVLAYLVKMETRIYMPLMSIYVLGNILLLFKADVAGYAKKHNWRLSAIIGLIVTIGFWLVISLCIRGNEQRKIGALHNQVIAEIGQVGAGKTVMLDVDSRIFAHSNPFTVVKYPTLKNPILYDNGQMAIVATYKNYLDKECNCNSSRMADFYKFLYEHKQEVLFVSSPERLEFVKSYMKIVHGVNYDFVKLNGNYKVEQVRETGCQMFYYVFK